MYYSSIKGALFLARSVWAIFEYIPNIIEIFQAYNTLQSFILHRCHMFKPGWRHIPIFVGLLSLWTSFSFLWCTEKVKSCNIWASNNSLTFALDKMCFIRCILGNNLYSLYSVFYKPVFVSCHTKNARVCLSYLTNNSRKKPTEMLNICKTLLILKDQSKLYYY